MPWPPLIWSWDLEELSQWQVTDEVIVGLSGSSWPSAVGWKASVGCEGTALPLCPHGLLGGPTWAMFTGLQVARPPGPGEGGSVGHDAPPCALLENGQKPGQSESPRGPHGWFPEFLARQQARNPEGQGPCKGPCDGCQWGGKGSVLQANCTGTAEGPDVLSCGDQAGHWGSGRQRTCYSRPSPPAHTRGAVRPSRAWEGWPGLQPQAPKLDRKGRFLYLEGHPPRQVL